MVARGGNLGRVRGPAWQPLLVRHLNAMLQGSMRAYADYAEQAYKLMEKLADTEFDPADKLATNALIQGRLKNSSERGSLVLRLTAVAASRFNAVVSELKSAVRLIQRTAVEQLLQPSCYIRLCIWFPVSHICVMSAGAIPH